MGFELFRPCSSYIKLQNKFILKLQNLIIKIMKKFNWEDEYSRKNIVEDYGVYVELKKL